MASEYTIAAAIVSGHYRETMGTERERKEREARRFHKGNMEFTMTKHIHKPLDYTRTYDPWSRPITKREVKPFWISHVWGVQRERSMLTFWVKKPSDWAPGHEPDAWKKQKPWPQVRFCVVGGIAVAKRLRRRLAQGVKQCREDGGEAGVFLRTTADWDILEAEVARYV